MREKIAEIAAADFFLAFDDEVQINREIAVFLNRLLNAEDVREDLTFVVGGTTRKDVAIFQHRLERRRIPKLQRIGRLNIIVSVNHHRLAAGLMFVFRPDHRMARRRHQLRFQADRGQFFHQPMRAFSDLFSVGLVGRNTREPEELIIIFEMTCAHAVTLDRFCAFCYWH